MNTTFEDNTAVTLEDLNNVAVDLGHADFSAFDTEKFGVDKLNQITSDLVSSGVLRTGENGALGCEVIVSDGKAYVQAGIIVFASGAKMRITDPVGIDLLPNTFIYAMLDLATGTAKLEASENEPAGDYVLLAKVDADGTLADRRSSCVAKVNLTADPQNIYREFTVSVELDYGGVTEVDVGSSAFSYIYVIKSKKTTTSETNSYTPRYENASPLLDGAEEVSISLSKSRDYTQDRYGFRKEGQYLFITNLEGETVCKKKTLSFILM